MEHGFIFDYEKIISDLKLRKAKLSGDNLVACCPNPDHDERHPSFGINLITGEYNCFSCGFKGKYLSDLYAYLKEPFSAEFRDFAEIKKPEKKVGELKLFYKAYDNINEPHFNVLYHRGLGLPVLQKYRVGYNQNGIIFPILGAEKELKGWQERNGGYIKYKMCPDGVDKKPLLFGEHLLEKDKPVIIVEGSIDALKAAQAGYVAVSTMGNRLYKEQVLTLLSYTNRFCIIHDNDSYGHLLVRDALRYLKGTSECYYTSTDILYEDVKDIGDGAITSDDIKFLVINKKILDSY